MTCLHMSRSAAVRSAARAAALLLALACALCAFAPAALAAFGVASAPSLRNAVGANISGFSTEDIHGHAVNASVLEGHGLTVLHYFATWSPEAIAEMDYMQRAASSFEASGLLVLGLLYEDSLSTPEACAALLEDQGCSYNCLRLDAVLSELVSVYPMIPQTFFVNSAGIVVDHFPGCFESYEQFSGIIESMLGQPSAYHTVRFVDGLTGRLISRQSVIHGGSAIPPTPPVHDGYIFKGWDGDYRNVTEDRVITALYVLDSSFYQMGDVDMNGVVEITDAVLTLRFAIGVLISEGVRLYGDMNGDGSITVSDAITILRIAMGLR